MHRIGSGSMCFLLWENRNSNKRIYGEVEIREEKYMKKKAGGEFTRNGHRQQSCITSFEHAVLSGDWACSPRLLQSG